MRFKELVESDAGTTASGNFAVVVNPGSTLPKSSRTPGTKANKAFVGSPGKSGTKTPPQPKPKSVKPTDNALDSNVGFFTGGTLKR